MAARRAVPGLAMDRGSVPPFDSWAPFSAHCLSHGSARVRENSPCLCRQNSRLDGNGNVAQRLRRGWLLNGTIDHGTSTRKATINHYTAEQQFLMPVDAAWLRLAVRDVATGRLGSLEIALPLASELKPSVQSPRD